MGHAYKKGHLSRCRWVVGCMSGTSLDGVDAALCEISWPEGHLAVRCVGHAGEPLGSLREVLLGMARGDPHPPEDLVGAARRLGALHATLVERLRDAFLPAGARLDLLVAHGQTICHLPHTGLSWQLFDPWPCVRRLGVPVLYDLRQADLIAGGQGAPITPVADAVLFAGRCDVVVNLGGICNVSDVRGEVTGRDVGPCNLLIDQVVQRLFPDLPYDDAGAIAAAGKVRGDLFAPLQDALPADRLVSLGREGFGVERIAALVAQAAARWPAADIVASAVAFVAEVIGGWVERAGARRIVLAGGGVRNATLVASIRAACPAPCTVISSDVLGVDPQAREAVCMAVLGALTDAGRPITTAAITGAQAPSRAGAWAYP